ncbi:RNA exonuclease 1 homolog [Halyomorpha halys]|uniref:RNA exonuclease 1 homolog n=1 Tax=Halyomorpha halys TaxID=286706 RepID=UPI0006D51A9A|nr:RNA exonuclease 1 homolog [Halyomorpha halys]
MLPSKGYFSGMPCPFYDSGICERPHCHFRHSKKDRTNPSEEDGSKSDKDSNVNIIKELVTETVKHVLSHTDIRDKTENSGLNADAIVTNVVKTFQPGIESKIDGTSKEYASTVEVPSYKPTPISELNKKHIPVVYAPTRPVYLDRFKKREIKESALYTPKSLSDNSSSTTTYIPSSSKARCEAYSPENVSSYRYFTNQISEDNITATNDESNILTKENGADNVKQNYGSEISNLKTLEALDKLIEDEFNNKPILDSLEKDNVKVTKEVELKPSITPDNISDSLRKVLPPKVIGGEDSSQKNKNHLVSKHSHSSHEKHSHSKSKVRSSDSSSKSHTNKEKSSKLSKSDEKHSSSKCHSSDHSSKPVSSHDRHSHSRSKTHSNESSKYSSSHDKHPKSKNHANHSSSKSHTTKEKTNAKITSKKCLKDKDKSTNIKDKSKPNLKENKNLVKSTSENKLLKNKEKEDLKKSDKKKILSGKEKLSKDIPLKKISSDSLTIIKSDAFIEQNSVSSSSDLEEIQCPLEPILIDSSSSSSSIIEHCEELSHHSMSPKMNLDSDSDTATNIRSSPSASEYAYDSPPPAKRLKEDEDDLKVTPVVFTSSLFSDRWKKARETVKKSSAAGKIKIAHVPNVTSLLNAKDKIIAKAKSPTKDDLTNSKKIEDVKKDLNVGKRARKAHMPSKERIKYPSLIMEENLKVPVSIRQLCLNNLYDEYLKYCEEEEAKVKAQTDEIEICRRLHVPKTYQNAVALSLLKIRKLQGKSDTETEIMSLNILLSHSVPEFTYGWTIYKCFSEYLMKEEEFTSHGFPIEIKSKSGIGYIEKSARRYDVKQPDDPNSRICANCSNNYYVDDKGFPVKEYDCFYHWGRLARTRVRGGITEFYRCCNGEIGSEACTNGRYHVCNSYDEDCLEGFITSRPSNEEPEKAGIYAMDCEMCYTTKGLDLTRCTVVDLNGKMVYDEVIVPEHPILDYNTRFSGITEDMIIKSRKKLRHVQRDLMKLINEKSILVGHSLENDFKALRLFHRTVVDTSIVFPHHMGLPYKRALKLIAKDILKINIQENDSGHDSYEDANTCMQIMMAKIKEDAKKRKPRVIISLDSKSKTKSNSAR